MRGRLVAKEVAGVLLALFVFPIALAGQGEGIPALVRRLAPSVVLVQTFANSGKRLNQGSGFFVSADGQFVTNRHVLLGSVRAQIRTAQGEAYDVAGIVAEDQARDLVRLAIHAPDGRLKPLVIAAGLPEAGEPILVIGNPMGLEDTVTDGIVSAIRTIRPWGQVIQMSAPISQGSSGSPVVNLGGQVVGVASFLRQDGQNLNFAIPAQRITEMPSGPLRPLSSLGSSVKAPEASSAEQAYLNGVAFLSQRSYEKALVALEEAIRLKPAYAEAYLHVGTCLEALGRQREAVEACRSAVLLRPEAPDFNVRLGEALELAGQRPEAAEAYLQAARLSLDNAPALAGLCRCYLKMAKIQEAFGACQQAARLRPDMAEAFVGLGEVYAAMGKHQQAYESFRRAIRTDPGSEQAHEGMGMALLKLDRADEGMQAFKEAVRLKPDSAQAHYGLGLCAVALKNKGLALDEYKILKVLDQGLADELFGVIY